MTKKEILDMTGLTEDEFYAQYPTEESFKQGGWIQKATASIKRRGTEGVCTGSKFGGPSCRPGTKRYALAKTFRKMAKARKKEDGGMVEMYEEGGDPPYTSRDRAQDSTSYADINIPFNMRKILLGDVYGSYEEIGSAEDYGYNPSAEKIVAHMRDPRASGYSHARQAAINAFRNKGAAGKLYLTNDEVAKIAKRFQDVDKEGKYTTPNNPMYGSNSYDLKATLSAPDYWRVMQEIKRNKSKKADGGVVDVYQLMGMPTPSMYEMGGDVMMEEYGRGGMIKRKDGSYSRRGLWDNIRANRGSGKKPTKEMLKQERKIRAAEKKEYGGMVEMYGMGGYAPIGTYSHVFSPKNHSNMGMAMGGAINYPEGLQMPIFAMGGMTNEPTQINVERGELLTDKDGRIVTEYRGGGMVPHPEEGIDERGTVPAKEGMFVITKAMAKKYKAAMKNNDKLYADTIRNNIAFNKQKKEAAEEQAAMTAYDKFTAKYGGTIRRMYAQGGMINKYADGDVVNAITNPLSLNNTAFGNVDMSAFNNPMTRFSGAAGFSNTPSSLNLNTSPMTMGQHLTGQTGSYMDYRNIPDTGIGYKGADTPPSDPNNFNYKDFMSQAIPYGVAASQVIEPLLQRPFKMKSQDYETPADLKWRELTGEAGRRDFERARAGMQDTVRNIGGSNALSALTGGANEYYRNLAAYNEALENKNRMGQSEIDRANKAIQQGNLNQRMQMAMFNEQNRAARRNAIRQGVMNVAGTYYNQQANQMTKQALSAGYPDYQFPWNKKKSS